MDAVFSSQTVSVKDCRKRCRRTGRTSRLQLGGQAGGCRQAIAAHGVPVNCRNSAQHARPRTTMFRIRQPNSLPGHAACIAGHPASGLDRIMLLAHNAGSADPFRPRRGVAGKETAPSALTGFGGQVAGSTPGRVGAVAVVGSADNTYYVKLHVELPQGHLLHPSGRNRFKSMS